MPLRAGFDVTVSYVKVERVMHMLHMEFQTVWVSWLDCTSQYWIIKWCEFRAGLSLYWLKTDYQITRKPSRHKEKQGVTESSEKKSKFQRGKIWNLEWKPTEVLEKDISSSCRASDSLCDSRGQKVPNSLGMHHGELPPTGWTIPTCVWPADFFRHQEETAGWVSVMDRIWQTQRFR